VPTWRARDVTREVDVVEEIARFRLEDVPFTLPARRAMFGRLTRDQRLRRRVEDVLVGLGFSETYTPSLRPDDLDDDALRLPEPISVDLAVLRTSLLPSLVETARRNAEVGNERIALFEIARVYLPSGGDLPREELHVAGVLEGPYARAKGAVEAIYAALKAEVRFEGASHPLLHPSRAARTDAGAVGELHPELLDGSWSGFELDLERLFAAARDPVRYEDVITYPAVRQDLAFVVDVGVPAGDLIEAARAVAPEVREVRFLSEYRGAQIGPQKKSIALGVSFQSPERTLSNADAAALREKVVAALAERFGAELRS
jgi:phenylalanyl-tRNA synthetase beta chain